MCKSERLQKVFSLLSVCELISLFYVSEITKGVFYPLSVWINILMLCGNRWFVFIFLKIRASTLFIYLLLSMLFVISFIYFVISFIYLSILCMLMYSDGHKSRSLSWRKQGSYISSVSRQNSKPVRQRVLTAWGGLWNCGFVFLRILEKSWLMVLTLSFQLLDYGIEKLDSVFEIPLFILYFHSLYFILKPLSAFIFFRMCLLGLSVSLSFFSYPFGYHCLFIHLLSKLFSIWKTRIWCTSYIIASNIVIYYYLSISSFTSLLASLSVDSQ